MTAMKKNYFKLFKVLAALPSIDWNLKGKDGKTVKYLAR